jgi:hypothetical protein
LIPTNSSFGCEFDRVNTFVRCAKKGGSVVADEQRRSRGLLALASGLVLATLGSGVWVYYLDNPITQHARANENENPANVVTRAEVLPADQRIARALEAMEKSQNSDESENRARRDLAAQEGAWRWTKWAVWISAVQAILSATGIAFVISSLRQGQASLSAARRAIQYAREANDIAERTQRPWIAVNIEPVFVGCRDGIFAVEAVVKFENVGVTPATTSFVCVELFHSDRSYHEGIRDRLKSIASQKVQTSLAILPNETIERRLSFMEEAEKMNFFEDADRKGIFLTIIVSAHYQAGNGVPGGWLETSRVVLLQRRLLTKGRNDAGHLISSFPGGDFAHGQEELAVESLAYDKAI